MCVCVCVCVWMCLNAGWKINISFILSYLLCWGGILGTASAIISSKCINILKIIVMIFGITL
jgi:hypothetical protein